MAWNSINDHRPQITFLAYDYEPEEYEEYEEHDDDDDDDHDE